MNPLAQQILAIVLKNKHTSAAALAYVVAKYGCPILSLWYPAHKAQIDGTANILEGAAVAYGFAAAGDASKSATKEEVKEVVTNTAQAITSGNTESLVKLANPNPPPPSELPH